MSTHQGGFVINRAQHPYPSTTVGVPQHAPPSRTLFYVRSLTYKIAFISLFFAFGVYLITFSSKGWYGISGYYGGLWIHDVCVHSYYYDYSFKCLPDELIFKIVQALFCLCLIMFGVTLLIGLVENCCRTQSNIHSRKVEICLLFTGIFGGTGIAIFHYIVWRTHSFHHSWCYFLTLVTIVFVFIIDAMIWCSGKTRQPLQNPVVLNYSNPTQPQSIAIMQIQNQAPQTVLPNQQNFTSPYPATQPPTPAQYYPPVQQPLIQPQGYIVPPSQGCVAPPPPYSLPPTYSSQAGSMPTYQPVPQVEASAPSYSEAGPLPEKR